MGVTVSPPDVSVAKELFPCPLPFPDVAQFDHESIQHCSRAVRSRLRSNLANQEWANSAVGSLNEIYGRGGKPPARPSAAQEASLSRIRASFSQMPKAECMDSAAAFNVLCGGLAG